MAALKLILLVSPISLTVKTEEPIPAAMATLSPTARLVVNRFGATLAGEFNTFNEDPE